MKSDAINPTKLKILCLEDEPRDADLMQELITSAGYDFEMAVTAAIREYESMLGRHNFDIILSDFTLPGFDAFEALKLRNSIAPQIPFICISGSIGEETAIELLKMGAMDYVLKDRPDRLPYAIRQALDDAKEKAARKRAEEMLRESEAIYRTMFANHPQPMWIYDVETLAFLEVNDAAIHNYGYSREEFLSMTIKDIRPKEDQSVLFEYIKKERESFNPAGQWRHVKKSGDIIIVEITSHDMTFNGRKARHVLAQDITERKRAEEALKLSEDKYRTIFENVQDVFYQTDLNGIILEISPSIKYFSDFVRDELIGKPVSEIYFNPDDRVLLLDELKEKGELIDYELKLKSRTGEVRYTSINARLIYNSDGKPHHIDGAIRDITERKKVEIELQKSRETYKAFFEDDATGDYTATADGKLLACNPAYLKMLGFNSLDEALQINLAEVYPTPEDHYKILEIIRKQSRLEDYEFTLIRRDGQPIYVIGNIIGYFNEKGKLDTIKGYLIDNTKRKIAELELIKFSEAIKQSPLSVIITDIDGNIKYVNPAFEKTTGYLLSEVLDKNPRILKSSEMPQEIYADIWKALLSGKAWRGELLNRKKNGELFWEDSIITPIKDADGKVISYVAVKLDITEKKKITAELIEAKERAEQSDRLKSEFLAQMSHEIRTPLYAIMSFTEILYQDLPENFREESADVFTAIKTASKRIIRTIDLILNTSEMQIGTYEPSFETIDLMNDIILIIFSEFTGTAKVKGLKFDLVCNVERPLIRGDRYSIMQIFSNLIDNAIKYTEKGSVSVIIDKENQNKIRVSVTDTGIGISNEFMEHLFKPFMQEERGYSRRFEGSGLGLTLVKKYCELNNVHISVASKKNEGTTFTLLFEDTITDNNKLVQDVIN